MGFYSENEQEITDNGLNELKPAPKNVGELNVLDKYKSDLSFLQNGKSAIERRIINEGVDDERINKQLKRLSKSIEKLEKLIKEFEDKLESDLDKQ